VYTGVDPRAALLLSLLPNVMKPPLLERLHALARAASKAAAGHANVDFALGAVAIALEMPVGATEAIFAVARTAGWIAHAIEEYTETPLRFRARSMYVGATT
jgi:citrate synthase